MCIGFLQGQSHKIPFAVIQTLNPISWDKTFVLVKLLVIAQVVAEFIYGTIACGGGGVGHIIILCALPIMPRLSVSAPLNDLG